MHSSTYIAALGAFFSAVAAIPMKRDLIINTVTEVEVVTQVLTATVWVDAPEATPTLYEAHYSHGSHEHHTSAVATSEVQSTTSTSVYVAPPQPTTTTSSTTTSSSSSSSSTSSTSSSTTQAPPVYTAPPQPAPPAPAPAPTYVAPEPSTTSTYVAPAPTTTSTSTSQYVAPAYTPPPATTSTTAAAAPVSTSTGSSSGQYTGDITYYAVGLGSCGETNTDSEMVVAMAHGMMNKATMCGKTITMSYKGVTQQAKVVDTCMSCVDGDLDLSPALFKAIAPNGDGRVHGVSWSFN